MSRAKLPVLRDRGRERAADRAAEHGTGARGRAAQAPAPASLGLGAGVALPARERGYFERRLGADLSGVRVHAESAAAPRLGARAFAAGRDIGFAPGAYAPGTEAGRRLLGHELAHVVQQGASGPAVQLQDAGGGSDAAERALDAAWRAAQRTEAIQNFVFRPLERHFTREWNALEGWQQGALIGQGTLMYTLALGGMLGSSSGRSLLSDVNLVAPLSFVPYATLQDFRFILPATENDPLLFRAGFDAGDLLGLARGHADWVADMSLRFDITWATNNEGDVWVQGFQTRWSPVPGMDLSVGTGVGLPGTPSYGVGGMMMFDMTKLPFIPAPVRYILGGAAPE